MPSQGKIGLWWKAESDDDLHKDLIATVDYLLEKDRARRDDINFHLALYGDQYAKESIKGYDRLNRRHERLAFNMVKAIIDTAQAEIAQLNPKPTFLTQRGNWSIKKKAQAMELMVEGEYDRHNVYTEAADGFLSAAKTGYTGFKVGSVGGRVAIDRVFEGEVLVDPIEAQYGEPRTIYHIRPVPRESLLDEFDDDKAMHRLIESAELFDARRWFPWLPSSHDSQCEQVLHIEAWRLPIPGTDKGGKHIRAVRGGILDQDEWTRDHFPIAGWSWNPEAGNFFGCGIAKELRPMQRELNYVLQKIQDCIHIGSTFRYLVEGNSKVNVEHLTNTPGEILRFFGGMPPQVQVINAVPQELLRHAEDIIRRGFEQTGISLMSAMAKKPAGLNSGAALREHEDIESRRFIIKSKSWERFLGVRLAKLVLEEKRAIAQRGEEPEPVKAEVRRGRSVVIRHIKWEDADLDEDSYQIRVFPASALPSQPSGRIAMVEQWVAAGFIDRNTAMRLLDFPDLDDYMATELSPYEIVLDAIERMIEDGEFMPPEPVMNHELAIDLVQLAYQRYRWEGVPEERTELLLRYMDDLRWFIDQAKAAQAAAQPAPGAEAGMPMDAALPAGGTPMPAAVAGPILGPGTN